MKRKRLPRSDGRTDDGFTSGLERISFVDYSVAMHIKVTQPTEINHDGIEGIDGLTYYWPDEWLDKKEGKRII